MNEYETEKKNTDQEFDAAKVWQLVPEFRYQFPKLIEVLHENLLPIIILLIWFLATGLWALLLPGRLSVREF